MNTSSVKRDLLNSLKDDPEFRHAWNLENVYTGLSFQIRALREQRGWSQVTLGKTAKMAQERISILEDPNAETKPTLSTLLRIADAYDVGLEVRFVPYSTVLDRSTRTNMKELEVPSFSEELPLLENEIVSQVSHWPAMTNNPWLSTASVACDPDIYLSGGHPPFPHHPLGFTSHPFVAAGLYASSLLQYQYPNWIGLIGEVDLPEMPPPSVTTEIEGIEATSKMGDVQGHPVAKVIPIDRSHLFAPENDSYKLNIEYGPIRHLSTGA